MRSMDLTDLNKIMRSKYIQKVNNKTSSAGSANTLNHGSNTPSFELDPIGHINHQAKVAQLEHEEKLQRIEDEGVRAIQETQNLKDHLAKEQLQTEIEKAIAINATINSDIKQLEIDRKHADELKKLELERLKIELKEKEAQLKKQKFYSLIKSILLGLAILLMMVLLCLGLYRLYRWSVETPLIKEVVKQVEVPVEKIVEKEKIIEKEVEVIPDECTQIRRNGKIYVSCDGVNIDGANTIGDSGVKNIPELLPE